MMDISLGITIINAISITEIADHQLNGKVEAWNVHKLPLNDEIERTDLQGDFIGTSQRSLFILNHSSLN
jgi:hypothetical protein